MRNLKIILAIILFCFLSSCATLPYQLKDRNFETGKDKGILICSVREVKYSMLRYPSSSYDVRRIGGNENFDLKLNGLSVPKQEIKTGVDCEVLIFELPAGVYEMYRWDLFFNMGLIQYHKEPLNHFSIPFTIEPDSISYIGELAVEDYILRIVDENQRDVRIAFEHEPSISKLKILKPKMSCQSGCSNEVKTTDEFYYVPIIIPIPK